MNELEAEHGAELVLLTRLLPHLRTFRERLAPTKAAHYQHYVFADRAASLGNYLGGCLVLVKQHLYPQAFALLRAALEHQVIDLLLFLGKRYVQEFKSVDDGTWEAWQKARQQKEEWTLDIADWRRSGSKVWITRTGPHLSGGAQGPRALSVSQYYFLLEDFDPVAGNPSRQRYLTTGPDLTDVFIRRAKANREIYQKALSWSALKENLRVNKLYTLRTLAHLDVHYAFLSAFVHPTSAGFRMVYGHNALPNTVHYDHYAAELCLLYAAAIARAELLALKRMSTRAPRVPLRSWEDVEPDIVLASRQTAHLWFPPDGRAHVYDRIADANRRAWRRWGKPGGGVVDPRAIPERSIRYYREPLRRLVRMHSSSHEFTTGLIHRSPWEREDAQRRL
jgi:hypothetical protein